MGGENFPRKMNKRKIACDYHRKQKKACICTEGHNIDDILQKLQTFSKILEEWKELDEAQVPKVNSEFINEFGTALHDCITHHGNKFQLAISYRKLMY